MTAPKILSEQELSVMEMFPAVATDTLPLLIASHRALQRKVEQLEDERKAEILERDYIAKQLEEVKREHEIWCPHFHVEYQNMKSRLAVAVEALETIRQLPAYSHEAFNNSAHFSREALARIKRQSDEKPRV